MSVLACVMPLLAAGIVGSEGGSWAVAVLPSGHEYRLEVAADDASRQRGYMFREQIGPRDGMLFVFESSARHSFWMKNCKVALDILWLDEAYRVVHVAADQPPCPLEGPCLPILPLAPARYVLEFPAGTAAREGLAGGSTIVVLSNPPLK